MNRTEVNLLLSKILPREDQDLDPPSEEDWSHLENKFECKFSEDFRAFIELMARYRFPGDIFNVSTGRTNGNDTITLVYDLEMELGHWDPEMIPYYGIGNGDYFCINKKECPNSAVYYFYCEAGRFQMYAPSFHLWLQKLPEFLAA